MNYKIGHFLGVNKGIDESLLKDEYSPDAQNIDTSNGVLATGKGYSIYKSIGRATKRLLKVDMTLKGLETVNLIDNDPTSNGTISASTSSGTSYYYDKQFLNAIENTGGLVAQYPLITEEALAEGDILYASANLMNTTGAISGEELYNDATTSSTTNNSYSLIKSHTLTDDGNANIIFDLNKTSTFNAYAKIYKNGVAIGTERTATNEYNTYQEAFDGLLAGDTIQIYGKGYYSTRTVTTTHASSAVEESTVSDTPSFISTGKQLIYTGDTRNITFAFRVRNSGSIATKSFAQIVKNGVNVTSAVEVVTGSQDFSFSISISNGDNIFIAGWKSGATTCYISNFTATSVETIVDSSTVNVKNFVITSVSEESLAYSYNYTLDLIELADETVIQTINIGSYEFTSNSETQLNYKFVMPARTALSNFVVNIYTDHHDSVYTLSVGNLTLSTVPQGNLQLLYSCTNTMPQKSLPTTTLSNMMLVYQDINKECVTADSKTIAPSDIYSMTRFMYTGSDVLVFANGDLYSANTVIDTPEYTTFTKLTGTKSAPKAKIVLTSNDKIWCTGDPDFPLFVYSSKLGTYDDFVAYDSADPDETPENAPLIVNLNTDNGGKIVTMTAYQGDIIVFKQRSIIRIDSSNGYLASISAVEPVQSAISEKSVVTDGNLIYFLSQDGIMAYNGITARLIDNNMTNLWRNMNPAYEDASCAIFFENKLYFAIPEGSSKTNNCVVVYDLQSKIYMIQRGFSVNDFAIIDNKLLFGNDDFNIYEFDTSTTFNTIPMVCYWETPMTELGEKRYVKTSQELWLEGEGTVLVEVITDEKTVSKQIALTEKPKRHRIKNRGRKFKLRLSNVNGSTFLIRNGLELTIDVDQYSRR